MSIRNISNIAAIARDSCDPEFKNVSIATDGPFAEALATARARVKEQQAQQLGELVFDMLKHTEAAKSRSLNLIREYKRAHKREKFSLDLLDKCLAYAEQTSNFVPLGIALGMSPRTMGFTHGDDEFTRLATIPSGWTPKSE